MAGSGTVKTFSQATTRLLAGSGPGIARRLARRAVYPAMPLLLTRQEPQRETSFCLSTLLARCAILACQRMDAGARNTVDSRSLPHSAAADVDARISTMSAAQETYTKQM